MTVEGTAGVTVGDNGDGCEGDTGWDRGVTIGDNGVAVRVAMGDKEGDSE